MPGADRSCRDEVGNGDLHDGGPNFGREHIERNIRERRDPRRRGRYGSESVELAANGLVNLGFRRAEVRRALDAVTAHHRAEALSAMPVQTILREALAVLA